MLRSAECYRENMESDEGGDRSRHSQENEGGDSLLTSRR
jgi:hypothetical protein